MTKQQTEQPADQIKRGLGWPEPFTQIPDRLINDHRLSPNARLLFCILCTHLNIKRADKDVWPGQESLAKRLGKNRQTVARGLKELKAVGWIGIKRQGLNKPNIYTIHGMPQNDPDVSPIEHPEVTPIEHQDVSPIEHEQYESKQDEEKSSAASAPPPKNTQEHKKKKPRKRTAQDDMFDLCAYILYQTTPENQAGLSVSARANSGRTAKRLLKMNASEELVREWFKWWKNAPTDWNWQKKKGKPDPKDLSDSWSAFLEYREQKHTEAEIDAANHIQAPPDFMAHIEAAVARAGVGG